MKDYAFIRFQMKGWPVGNCPAYVIEAPRQTSQIWSEIDRFLKTSNKRLSNLDFVNIDIHKG